jgi:Leucine-rich repeat (LRR) protein
LERLFFNGTSITSLEPIRNLTTLKKLSCHENFINSLEEDILFLVEI